jgi:hypothetical protein
MDLGDMGRTVADVRVALLEPPGEFDRDVFSLVKEEVDMRSTKWLAALVFVVGLALPSIGYSADSDSSYSGKNSKSSADDRGDSQKQSRNQQSSNDDNAQHHAALGVSLRELDGRVKVIAVLPASPAARAGLQVGDEIRYVGDQRIRTTEGLAEEIGEYHPGSQVELSIRRDGEKKTLHARLASQESTFSSRDRGNRNAGNQTGWNDNRQANRAQRAAYSYAGNEEQQNVSMLSQQLRTLQQQVSRMQQEVNQLRADQNGGRIPMQQDEWNRDTRRGNATNGQSYRTTSRQQYDRGDEND